MAGHGSFKGNVDLIDLHGRTTAYNKWVATLCMRAKVTSEWTIQANYRLQRGHLDSRNPSSIKRWEYQATSSPRERIGRQRRTC
jgi:hypothetical protein